MSTFVRRAQFALFVVLTAVAASGKLAAQTYLYNQTSFVVGGSPAAVVAADFNSDGNLDLAVANRADNTISIVLAKPDGTFAPQVTYPTGQSPVALAAADFNNDGKMDLAVANLNGFTISIFLGNGDGTFSPGAIVSVSSDPQALVVGDWNGDGKVDLVVALFSGNVAILLGNGDGTFAPEVDHSVGSGSEPMWITAADFNNDGIPDLATANENNGTFSILIGKGDGTFAQSVNHPYFPGTTTSLQCVLAADFSGDHNIDLALVDRFNSTVSILFGNGDGTFQAPVNYPVGLNPLGGAVADLNRDGMPDLIVSNSYDGTVSVLLNKGNGTFQSHVDYGTTGANFLSVGDFNRDGLMDVAVANSGYPSGTVTVLLGNPDGTFARTTSYSTSTSSGLALARGIAGADLTGNGKLDLITSNPGWYTGTAGTVGQISVLMGNSDGTFQSPNTFPGGGGNMAITDFNGDGKPDLAIPGPQNENWFGTSVAVFLGNGDGTFQPGNDFATSTGPITVATGDFNRDGKPDLAVVGYGSATVSILIGNGDGTFQGHVDYAVGAEPTSVAVGDFNADGKLDIAVANQYDGTFSVLLGNGNGTFQSPVTYTAGGNPSGIAAADLNGDGKLDLVVATGRVSVSLGNGDGTFQPYVNVPALVGATALVVSDFNGDGIPDVATANELNSTFSVLIGRGDGTFSGPWVFWTPGNSLPNSITTGDFNGDGSQDITVAGQEGVVTVLLNEPAMAISYPQLDFGAQIVGTTSAPLPITITNVGGARLSISRLSAGGNFTATDNCVGTLAIATHCTVNVTFTPTQTGSIAGTFTVTDNNSGVAGSVQTVALSGMGTVAPPSDFTVTVASGSSSSATVSPGGTATYSLNIGSLNGFAQSVALTCSIAVSPATCAVSPTTVSPTGTAVASVTVSVRTTAPSLAVPLGPNSHQRPPLLWMIGLASLLALVTLDAALRRQAPRRWVPAFANATAFPIRKAMCAALFLIALTLASCGGGGSGVGGNSNPGTPAGTYSLTVNGTSGSLSHSTTLTLTVN
jgi:FG-GAP-like repeat/Abnormal spindle-like microcephaly-assoc'd, ASPM-SPD-2-Hydin